MITIYEERLMRAPQPIAEAVSASAAAEWCRLTAIRWMATKSGRTAKVDGMTAALAYSDGKPYALLYGEAVTVPHEEPDAQPRRKGGAA